MASKLLPSRRQALYKVTASISKPSTSTIPTFCCQSQTRTGIRMRAQFDRQPRLRPSSSSQIQSYRTYYSSSHPPPPSPFTPTETAILSAATRYIPTHGFTTTTLALGAKDMGYIDASVNLFPKGPASLVHFWLVREREALKGRCEDLLASEEQNSAGDGKTQEKGFGQLGVGGKVRVLTWERLMANQAVVHRWQEALALLSLPSNIPLAVRELALLSDEIFYLAGDVSVDTSWYTKRGSLSGIYAATELFMTTDKSEGFAETREFLDRRLDDVKTVGGVVGNVGEWVGFGLRSGVNVLRSKGVRM